MHVYRILEGSYLKMFCYIIHDIPYVIIKYISALLPNVFHSFKIYILLKFSHVMVLTIYSNSLDQKPKFYLEHISYNTKGPTVSIKIGYGLVSELGHCLEFGESRYFQYKLYVTQPIINNNPGGDIKVLKYTHNQILH